MQEREDWVNFCMFFLRNKHRSILHFAVPPFLTNQVAAFFQETKLLPKMEQLSIDCHGLVEDNLKILEASFILIPYQGYKEAVHYKRFFLLRKDSDITFDITCKGWEKGPKNSGSIQNSFKTSHESCVALKLENK